MAPNISHLRLLSGPIGLRPASGTVIKAAPAAKDYQPQSATSADEAATYWQWESPKDLFSADHITANLTKAAAVAVATSTSKNDSSHDDYWAEATPVQANYWDERSHSGPVNVSYWAEATAPRHHEGAVAPSYWDEANHSAVSSSSNDAYWREAQLPSQEDDRYWQWSGSQPTARDRYWVM
jgi:hypothetical protein